MNGEIELLVPAGGEPERLDAWLGREPRIGSRSSAARLIAERRVTLDGRAARKSDTVSGGEAVKVSLPGEETASGEPAVPFTVVYEDAHLLVVDKPAGLVVHPAPGNRAGTLSQALSGRVAGGPAERAGIVHRLDKETSGLLVVAKDDDTLRALQAALRDRAVRREYLALVCGEPRSRSGTIDAPLGRDRRSPEQMAVRAGTARDAVTHFEVVERLAGHALLRVRLETGRTHQIRAHLAAIDLPVSGDATYGVPGDLGLRRQFLHAALLAFDHPESGDPLVFESPLPEDLQAALQAARELHG